jgi:hypothetical protein
MAARPVGIFPASPAAREMSWEYLHTRGDTGRNLPGCPSAWTLREAATSELSLLVRMAHVKYGVLNLSALKCLCLQSLHLCSEMFSYVSHAPPGFWMQDSVPRILGL